ncbi:MAG: N4-gp56 family major capsid protein, partial [Clostridia bacterium]|nr:N4-gp56 family major capsid protein [Clostridia bacterium]
MSEPNTNVTTQSGLSDEMKTYYDTELLENVRANLVFNQFAKTKFLPGGKGKKVEWRKFNTYAKATTPLTEGVTPDGESVTVTSIEAPVKQYGSYTTVSDLLDMTAVDDTIL